MGRLHRERLRYSYLLKKSCSPEWTAGFRIPVSQGKLWYYEAERGIKKRKERIIKRHSASLMTKIVAAAIKSVIMRLPIADRGRASIYQEVAKVN